MIPSFDKCPKLLVSVRDASEAKAALVGGVHILDIKEPANGPLGMASPDTLREIVTLAQKQAPGVPVTAALGELGDWDLEKPDVTATVAALHSLARLGLWRVKVGFAGADSQSWHKSFQCLREALSLPVIPVAYADNSVCAAPTWRQILPVAVASRSGWLLIDTFEKAGKTVWDHLSPITYQEICTEVHRRGLRLALAGSVNEASLAPAQLAPPDVIAVRGAVCAAGQRQADVAVDRVRRFREILEATPWRQSAETRSQR